MNEQSFFINKKDGIYPELLRQIYKGPSSLFYKGKLETLNKTCIAIVGTRRPSDYGQFMTEKIVKELALWDVAIVSGLAKGIDTIAHETALKEGMKTIAILGSGINNIYPHQNQKLASKIENAGLILSEYENMEPPLSFHFIERNRIISGLSIATVVIEAPQKSGALITADYALEQNREVFVVPGDADRSQSEGVLSLLQKGGAYPISSGAEIINCLKKQPQLFSQIKDSDTSKNEQPEQRKPHNIAIKSTPIQKIILKNLNKRRGKTMDILCALTKLDIIQLMPECSFLEIQGIIKIDNGRYFLSC